MTYRLKKKETVRAGIRRIAREEIDRALSRSAARSNPLLELPAWDSSSRLLHVVVDTPKGSAIKFKFDLEKGCYTIAHILPVR